MCVSANVGREPAPQFNAAGERPMFCATTQSDGMGRLPDQEARSLLRRGN